MRRLGSRKRSCVDSARARLATIGAGAVEDLIGALEGDDARIRARVMPLLALIRDSRGRKPLMAMLLDTSFRLRAIAAQSLSRFPSNETVAALTQVLARDKSRAVKVAAARALIELYSAGLESALPPLLELLSDRERSVPVRLAGLALLPRLARSERRGILRTLKTDDAEEIRALALEMERDDDAGTAGAPVDNEALLAALACDDYAVWNRAVHSLADGGSSVVAPLLEEIQSRAHDPEYCARAGMVLKALGPRRGRALVDALHQVDEPLPLQVLVEVIGAYGDKSLIYRLKGLIERLSVRPRSPTEANGLDLTQRVVARAHLELARIGSRVAIDDLREVLGDPERRVENELLAAVERIGNREEIVWLLQAHEREDPVTRQRIAAVIVAIMKRERLRRNDRFFRTLSPERRRRLLSVLPPPRGRAASRRGARPEANP